MKRRNIFPSPDSNFDEYIRTVIPYLEENRARLLPVIGREGIAADIPAPVNNLVLVRQKLDRWIVVFPLNQNPATRTTSITLEKTDLRIDIENLLRQLYGDIPLSVLTEKDEVTLHIHRKFNRDNTNTHPVTPIMGMPVFGMIPIGGGEIKFTVRAFTDSKRASKPLGTEIEVRYKVFLLDEPPPSHVDDMIHSMISSRALFVLNCGTNTTEKVLYAACRWIDITNPSRNGPWTAIQHTAIA